jgi:hydrogenase maturation protein HypF
LGGFHLIANATHEKSLHRLRRKKNRPEKPFAIMAPDLGWVKILCEVSEEEKKILQSPESPIVLLQYREPLKSSPVAPSVAPGLTTLGIMLPYTPLHHLFLKELGLPVVATSGNLSDEPLCIDEHETIKRLNPIADLFLVHNRPIARQLDDSLVRFVNNRLMILRRARGYTPVPIGLNKIISPTLSVGAHLKNTIALSSGNQVFISQHIGDLNSALSFHSFRKTISDFKRLFNIIPEKIVSDAHPNYTSTQYAQETELPNESVQHHYAHVLSCMAEHQLESPLLGVSWDGTGFGLDGTIWGGEFLQIHENSFSRVAHFRNFPLPGGEKAIREPRRSALGLLYEVFGTSLFENTDSPFLKSFLPSELKVFQKMLSQKLNSPYTCSVGRLFDAIAAIIGIRNKTSYEGQAAMELEVASENAQCMESYPFQINVGKTKNDGILIVDWGPMVSKILKEISSRKSKGTISSKFHNTLVEIIIQVTKQVGEKRVILTGGCFQNKTLTEKATARLTQEGLIPYWNQQVPPNDGGISLGQIIAASRKTGER